uniref:Beta-galactosidase n=1 Tax=Xenopsylla cheopis TaxID=163159 RepID=A0A6M2DWQ0_XENCH
MSATFHTKMLAILLCIMLSSVLGHEYPTDNNSVTERRFYIDYDNNTFVMDGKPFRYIAGSLHYFRIPHQYWKDRLEKLKAAGLNAVDTYDEWSFHNPKEGEYLWEGNADLVQFIKLAKELDLYVILRPGPYICAERDFGGHPYWLLSKYYNQSAEEMIQPRTPDYYYLVEVQIWMDKLFEKIDPLLYGNGGPIIMIQIENEYGSFDNDSDYKNLMYKLFNNKVKQNAVLFTTDGYWDDMPSKGKMGDAYATVNFGPGDNVEEAWEALRKANPGKAGPLVNSEYYTGWFTHWGEEYTKVAPQKVADTLRQILADNASVSLYMFGGGTNFEFTSGANFEDGKYLPQITSYDYDAPLTEAGDPTPKYMAIKEVIGQFVQIPEVKPVTISPKGSYGKFAVEPGFALFDEKNSLTVDLENVKNDYSYEALNQKAGFIIYKNKLDGYYGGSLTAPNLKDRALIYINDVYLGTMDRRLNNFSIETHQKNPELKLVVEHLGRINYGNISAEYKGLNQNVEWGGRALNNWNITSVPLTKPPQSKDYNFGIGKRESKGKLINGPIIYSVEFNLLVGLDGIPRDTFLDMTNWGKGVAWINGHNLGRYWPAVGPQKTLYVPKPYLKHEKNLLEILELEYANPDLTVSFNGSSIRSYISAYCLIFSLIISIILKF